MKITYVADMMMGVMLAHIKSKVVLLFHCIFIVVLY